VAVRAAGFLSPHIQIFCSGKGRGRGWVGTGWPRFTWTT